MIRVKCNGKRKLTFAVEVVERLHEVLLRRCFVLRLFDEVCRESAALPASPVQAEPPIVGPVPRLRRYIEFIAGSQRNLAFAFRLSMSAWIEGRDRTV